MQILVVDGSSTRAALIALALAALGECALAEAADALPVHALRRLSGLLDDGLDLCAIAPLEDFAEPLPEYSPAIQAAALCWVGGHVRTARRMEYG